jgi:hypothetical protein
MKKIALALILLVCIPRFGNTQARLDGPVKEFPYDANGYASFGFGVCRHSIANISGNAGGDVLLGSTNFTVGGEIGVYTFVERNSPTFGIAAFNFGYHFLDRTRPSKWEPFLSVGPGVGFGRASGAAVSMGGGSNYWVKPKVGIRTEGRVYSFNSDIMTVFRLGFSFR